MRNIWRFWSKKHRSVGHGLYFEMSLKKVEELEIGAGRMVKILYVNVYTGPLSSQSF